MEEQPELTITVAEWEKEPGNGLLPAYLWKLVRKVIGLPDVYRNRWASLLVADIERRKEATWQVCRDRLRRADEMIEVLAPLLPPSSSAGVDPRDDIERATGYVWPDVVAQGPPPVVPYWEYLQSQHWHDFSEARKTGHCEECGRDGRTDLHHIRYARLWHERPTDVEELCRDCHAQAHGLPRAA